MQSSAAQQQQGGLLSAAGSSQTQTAEGQAPQPAMQQPAGSAQQTALPGGTAAGQQAGLTASADSAASQGANKLAAAGAARQLAADTVTQAAGHAAGADREAGRAAAVQPPAAGPGLAQISQHESLKSALLALAASDDVPPALKETAQQLVQQITGQQLLLTPERNSRISPM